MGVSVAAEKVVVFELLSQDISEETMASAIPKGVIIFRLDFCNM